MHLGDAFLDTCVFLSRAIGMDMELNAGVCDQIISSGQALFTGSRVVDELKVVMSRRDALYQLLMAHIMSGKMPRSFDMSHMSKNDQGHFREILKRLDAMGTPMARSKFITQLNLSIKTSCADSLSRVKVSSLELPNGDYFIGSLGRMDVIEADARILLQYVSWGRGRALSSFVTNDGDHILGNRERILETAYTQFSFPQENLQVMHSKEAALLVRPKGT